MKTIHAIASGSYSDYTVHAVTTNKRTAETWAKALRRGGESSDPYPRSDARVEEIYLLGPDEKPFMQTTWTAMVELWDDGREDKPRVSSLAEYVIDTLWGTPPARPQVRKVRAPMHRNLGGRLEIRGRSERAVRKVLGEQLRLWRAAQPKRGYWG